MRRKKVYFLWVPSHVKIVGNEKADEGGREAHALEGQTSLTLL